MVKRDVERTAQQSLLDRLIDRDPMSATEPRMTYAQSVSEFKQAVRRDVEWLLNTRRTPEPATDSMAELQKSLHDYGLPDITSLSADAPEVRMQLARRIEEAITLFEPRLADVKITVTDTGEGGTRQLRFLIEGMLRMEPNPEQVAFDTILDTTNCNFEVK
jgi:type VI secretion system protein ImpF